MGDGEAFVYEGFDLDPSATGLTCRYRLGRLAFTETFEIEGEVMEPAAPRPLLEAAAGLVHLLAGVSYYKTRAPGVVDLQAVPTTASQRTFLRRFFLEGLGEFAYRNGLDLSDLEVRPGPEAASVTGKVASQRLLIPFGGGIDSIVTTEDLRHGGEDPALFVVVPGGTRLAAVEEAAEVAGLPVRRVTRRLDPKVLDSTSHGFLNGHVPVTGIISAVATFAALRLGYGTVAMSNEWSASRGTEVGPGQVVNHQWSKSLEFEQAFQALLRERLGPAVTYFSYLRERSELWVARRFAELTEYHRVFRSCNRAFAVDPDRRLAKWCGRCDKCCFVDLVLAPFLERTALEEVFDGREPLEEAALAPRFAALVGLEGRKPFECVGDVEECRVAAALAARRPDRKDCRQLQALAAAAPPASGDDLLGALDEPSAAHGDPAPRLV